MSTYISHNTSYENQRRSKNGVIRNYVATQIQYKIGTSVSNEQSQQQNLQQRQKRRHECTSASTQLPYRVSSSPSSSNENRYLYSNCRGKKKALLIGINYFGQRNQLRGCINDVRRLQNFLIGVYGYKPQDMVVLTDDSRDPISLPTKSNIIRGMKWLVNNAQPNDSLVFHFSGHGGQTIDHDGDEVDGYDEVIYPVDFRKRGHIVDDRMHDIMVKPLRPGVKLTAIFDCCHSGTVLDLPYVYSTKGTIKESNLLKDSTSEILNAVQSYNKGDINRALNTMSGVARRVNINIGDNVRQRQILMKSSNADVISISGCKDSQTSADATSRSGSTGVMSHAFISVLSENRNQTYISLLKNMRKKLKEKYSQKPQLSSSHPIDLNLKFLL